MENLIVLLIIVALVGSALAYIIKEKKKGARCIGCSAAGTCARRGKCGSETDTK